MVYPPAFIPETLTLENYYKVLFMSNYRTYFMNNIIVAVISVIFASVVAGHAAFAFSRMKFRHSEKIMFAVLMTAMIPPIAQLIPLYILAVKTGLYNTKIVLVLIYAAWRTPILTWLLKGFFEKIPRDIEESAMIDGCTKAGVFYKIVLPISKPGIASVALLSAVFVWNDYLVSASFVSAEKHRMLSPGIYNYITGYGVQWGQLMGGVCMAVIPIIILFISLQKQFVAGLSAGAVKG
jgi:ABC-type glycerol-3-phosphate transport system permease component